MFLVTFMLVAIFVAIILVGMLAIHEMNLIELQLQIIKHSLAACEAEIEKGNIELHLIGSYVHKLQKDVIVVSESEIAPDHEDKKMDDFFREVPGSNKAV